MRSLVSERLAASQEEFGYTELVSTVLNAKDTVRVWGGVVGTLQGPVAKCGNQR
jgi:hypothetical protein